MSPVRIRQTLFAFLVAALFGCDAYGDDVEEAVASAPAKLLGVAAPQTSPESQAAMMMTRPAPPVTLPAERFPQYQLGQNRSQRLANLGDDNGAVRFLIVAPSVLNVFGKPLLVSAEIRIDGIPFSARRKEHGRGILMASRQPPEPSPEPQNSDPAETDQAEFDESDSATKASAEGSPDETNDDSEEQEQASGEEPESDEANADEVVAPATVPLYQLASDPEEMMRRYAEAIGEAVSEPEADWMLHHWAEGPSVLVLHPYYQSFRADQRPVVRLLDRDRNGVVSEDELVSAAESMRQCDSNRDEVIDVLEIGEAAGALAQLDHSPREPQPVLLLLSDLLAVNQDATGLGNISEGVDLNHDGGVSQDDVERWSMRTPDLQLRAEFDTRQPDRSELQVTASNLAPEMAAEFTASGSSIELLAGGVPIQFSAIQSAVGGETNGQVSLGAVVDGYPLLPALDPNNDGRLTIREMRNLRERLEVFDVDQDATLIAAETQPPVRVAIGLGPIVHQHLADIRQTPAPRPQPTETGPDWFVRMDRNSDNDLSTGEFPGTQDQFEALDRDGDGLISAAEANQVDQSTPKESAE